MSVSIIYKTTNSINDKYYVGKHRTSADNYLGSGIALKKAIIKYGKCNFSREILEFCTSADIDIKEIYWIAQTSACKFGYNISKGGSGGPLSDYAKQKISEKNKGRVVSEKERKRRSEWMKKHNPFKGKKHSEESKRKMSEKLKGKSLGILV